MTAFVYTTATSINGFIADDGNSLDWLFAADDVDPGSDGGLHAERWAFR